VFSSFGHLFGQLTFRSFDRPAGQQQFSTPIDMVREEENKEGLGLGLFHHVLSTKGKGKI
jgi:hypothetical protein